MSEEAKKQLYKQAEIFIYPSLYEGFGLPVLEAMQAGVPVITSNQSSLPELCDGAAYLVNPYYVSELELGLRRLLGSSRLRDYYIEKGKMRSSMFNWQKTATEFLEVLSK